MENKKGEESVRDLFGQSLKNHKDGERILSYIEQLIVERAELLERQKHLISLTRLYEQTVYNADDLALQIKKEAEEKAQAEAQTILGQADEKVDQVLEEKRLEAVKIAELEARQIRDKYEQELEARLKEKKAALQALFRDYSGRLYNEILAQTEHFKQEAISMDLDIENSLSILSILSDPEAGTANGKDASGPDLHISSDVTEGNPVKQQSFPDETQTAEVSMEKAATELQWIEVEILPPRDKDAMEGIRTYLSDLDEVAAANMRHLTDKTILEVCLKRNMDMIETLSKLSEVEEIQEVMENGQKKIQIMLSVRSELEKAKDVLNKRANRVTSRR